MKLRVQYLAQLRDAVGASDEELELPDSSTLAGLLIYLAARHGPGARPHLINAAGAPQRSLLTVVNDRAVSASAIADAILQPGDIVTLMPPIAGG